MSFVNSSLIRSNNVFKLCNINAQYFGKLQVKCLPDKRAFCITSVKHTDETKNSANTIDRTRYVSPTNFQKKLLVWVGRFKSESEIPDRVTESTMDLANNKARIKTANYMILFTLLGCVVMVIAGKRAQKRGESVVKMNEDWHKEMDRIYKEEQLKKQS